MNSVLSCFFLLLYVLCYCLWSSCGPLKIWHLNETVFIKQVTHVRSVHTSGCGQQQEAVAVESDPESFSVFRTQENDPVRKSNFVQTHLHPGVYRPSYLQQYSVWCSTVCLYSGMSVRETYWPILHSALCTHPDTFPSRTPQALSATGGFLILND